MEFYPLTPMSKWINISTGKSVMVIRLFPEFNGKSVQFRKSKGGTSVVSEEQFLANHKPDADLDLNFELKT